MPDLARGPRNAKILIVGEAFGEDEHYEGKPFVGKSGRIMSGMLKDAGIDERHCLITNVVNVQPPNNEISKFFEHETSGAEPFNGLFPNATIHNGLAALERLARACQPNIIIAFGNTPLWAFSEKVKRIRQDRTGKLLPGGITNWRGSQLTADFILPGTKLIPTIHPAAISRQWDQRWYAVRDLKRARREAETRAYEVPPYDFTIQPTYEQTLIFLGKLLQRLNAGELVRIAVDIETLRRKWIACIGLATSATEAFCIPFLTSKKNYWDLSQEFHIVRTLRAVLIHPNCRVIGQNFNYDALYITRKWGFIPNLVWDTMTAQNVLYPSALKGLDFLSSLYCKYHVYWKEESKEWDVRHMGEQDLWTYNCKDGCATFEVAEVQEALTQHFNLVEPMRFQQSLSLPVLRMMMRGVRIDDEARIELDKEVGRSLHHIEDWLARVIGYPIEPSSNPQLQKFFYSEMKAPKQWTQGKDRRITTNAAALDKIGDQNPILRPVCQRINEYRSLKTVRGSFLRKEPDGDGRARSSFNIPGTETFRFSSSENPFGSGGNYQNLTTGEKADYLPNLRKMIVPDLGYIIIEGDLAKADAQVIAWEAGDESLKQMFREGVNIHAENAKTLFGVNKPKTYALAKRGVHAANYVVTARTLARHLGITVREAEAFIRRWFEAHPAIPRLHRRIYEQLAQTAEVRNVFGYRRLYFDRLFTDKQIQLILKEAVAWIGQSTVAVVTNRGLVRVYNELPLAQNLLQEHDSNVIQYPIEHVERDRELIESKLLVPIPYEDPLTIPVELKTSPISWGHAKPWLPDYTATGVSV